MYQLARGTRKLQQQSVVRQKPQHKTRPHIYILPTYILYSSYTLLGMFRFFYNFIVTQIQYAHISSMFWGSRLLSTEHTHTQSLLINHLILISSF